MPTATPTAAGNLPTPDDHAPILIDHPSQMALATKSIDPAVPGNNTALVARSAAGFKVSTIHATAFTHKRGNLRHGKVLALSLLAALATPAHAEDDTPIPPRSERATEIRLTDKITTIPLVMVREFPFIEGSIAGVEGKFMLDTGAQDSLSINDNRVPVSDARTIGSGFFGSGQTFKIRLVPELRDIRIGGLVYPRATAVESMDARLLEGITPDFIGWIGYTAFSGHAMKLDYQNLRATFYRHGETNYLESERVVAELAFDTRKLPNHPIQAGRIGDMDVVTSWDTGQHGNLYTSEEGKARLLREGRLTPSPTEPDSFDLHGLQLNGHTMPSIPSIAVHTTPSPAAAPVGISEADWLVLGYALLHQFKTVWDYDRQRIYLLERRSATHDLGRGRPAGQHPVAVPVSAVPSMMLKTADNPGGLPLEVFDGMRMNSLDNRSQLYPDIASGPFFGFNRPNATPSQGLIQSFRVQGMQAGHRNTYDSTGRTP